MVGTSNYSNASADRACKLVLYGLVQVHDAGTAATVVT